MSLKIHAIALDKDNWENVPPLVYKAFHVFSTNMTNIKKWADRQEERSRTLEEQQEELQGRLKAADAAARTSQEHLHQLADGISAISIDRRREATAFSQCIGELEACVRALFNNLGRHFGVELSALAANEGGEGGEASAEATANEDDRPRGLAALQRVGNSLELQIGGLHKVFECWDARQRADCEQMASMQGTINELNLDAERMRDRLFAWRELLQENSHVVDALGTSLVSTQGLVNQLRITQVQSHDVEEAVEQRAKQLEELHARTERRVDTIQERVETHVTDVSQLIEEAQKTTNQQIEEHSTKVAQLLERHMNPVNAYLNTMHVRADAMRVELDALNNRVPRLAGSIEELSAELRKRDESAAGRAKELEGRLTQLAEFAGELNEKGDSQCSALNDFIRAVSQELGEHIRMMSEALSDTAQALETVRQGDLPGLASDLSALGQKVARWVAAQPMPAKISEARLYALEARINEEIEARLALEQQVRDRSNRSTLTPRFEALALPQLHSKKKVLELHSLA